MAIEPFNSRVERAKAVDVSAIIRDRDLKLKGKIYLAGPCPNCGGTDRFGMNVAKQVFNCRRCGARGRGAIGLVMFLDGCNFKTAVDVIAGGEAPRYSPPPQPVKSRDGEVSDKRKTAKWLWEGREPVTDDCLTPRSRPRSSNSPLPHRARNRPSKQPSSLLRLPPLLS